MNFDIYKTPDSSLPPEKKTRHKVRWVWLLYAIGLTIYFIDRGLANLVKWNGIGFIDDFGLRIVSGAFSILCLYLYALHKKLISRKFWMALTVAHIALQTYDFVLFFFGDIPLMALFYPVIVLSIMVFPRWYVLIKYSWDKNGIWKNQGI